jgi:lipopolysaccharide export LptBFGC system permease protein LptF
MGRTLFWYVFRDLTKIFLMTSGTLAGIMSFGGLLRPLTQQGLDPGQVSQMLAYFSPAMTAYSMPIAALFAATVVYGRLSADNELTACRAGGISLGPILGMARPVAVFGVLVAAASLLFLCFVVPTSTLKAERVIYSNIAKLIANRIERTHEIKFGGVNIFAQRAYLPPPTRPSRPASRWCSRACRSSSTSRPTRHRAARPPARPSPGRPSRPRRQRRGGPKPRADRVPKEFLMASSATIDIQEQADDTDRVSLVIGLEGGIKYPREFGGGTQIGIGTTQFGPLEIPSPIKEDTKFMDVRRLKELYDRPEQSRKIAAIVDGFVRRDQVRRYAADVRAKLNQGRFFQLKGGKSSLMISLDPTAAPPATVEGTDGDEVRVAGTAPGTVTFEKTGAETSLQAAKEVRIRARPDNARKLMVVTVELYGRSPGGAATRPVSGNYSDVIEVPMPPEVVAMKDRKVEAYTTSTELPRKERDQLRRELIVLSNNILAESNGRASFAVSCLILVLVGAALGMLFKSGNFLTAFAVSFVPALVCITLIVAGQQMCHAVPFQFESKPNPLKMGLAFIWGGNVINFLIASVLMWRLARQ